MMLFGTRDKKIFPLKPGSHVPCATKHIISGGNKIIYCSIVFGIPDDRYQAAVTITEDIGFIPSIEKYQSVIMDNLVKSILQVGYNQDINYKAIYVASRFLPVNEGELGCALVAVPYFSLAQNAIPSDNIEDLEKMSLSEWAKIVLKL